MTENPKDRLSRDEGRPSITCVPMLPLIELAGVMACGARDYGRHNFRESPILMSVYIDAIFRHLMKLWEGEFYDEKTDLPHTAHIMACAAIISDAKIHNTLIDDRPPGSIKNTKDSYDDVVSALRVYMNARQDVEAPEPSTRKSLVRDVNSD